jgi:hypothetical protein
MGVAITFYSILRVLGKRTLPLMVDYVFSSSFLTIQQIMPEFEKLQGIIANLTRDDDGNWIIW